MYYGAWGRRASNPNKGILHDVILSKNTPKPSELERLYGILIEDEGPIAALLDASPQNHHFRAALVASPDEMLPRLSHFISCLCDNLDPRNSQSTNSVGGITPATANKIVRIPAAFTKHVILALANEPSGNFDIGSPGYQTFILAVLNLYISLAGIATVSLSTLRDLVSKILDMPREVQIIEKIVSEVTGTTLLTNLFSNNSLVRQVFTERSLCIFGSRLATLVTKCIASHGRNIEDIVLAWEKMEAIREGIDLQIQDIGAREWGATIERASIHLNGAEEELLTLAQIPIPYNITTAKHTVKALIDRHKEQIRLILSSFPCSTCKAQLCGIIKVARDDSHQLKAAGEFTDIKAPLGVFPIYLSDTAMRDLKSSRLVGTLTDILKTLQKLADGLWESEPELSSSGGKSRFGSEPMLRAARWCQDGYILWERGVGRAEENSEEWVQIVKIIRVGSKADMKKVISEARTAKRNYTSEYKKATAISIRNPNYPGALIPQRFVGNDTAGLEVNNSVIFGLSSASKALSPSEALTLHKIFCTGKQYALTKMVAEMILQGGHQAEIPFIVSPEEESIINYFDSSVCILGRSGTGKTTCLVFRLLATYIRDRMINEKSEVRQIFLTRSPVLAGKIRQYVNRLIDSHCMRFAIHDNITEGSDFDAIMDDEEGTTTTFLDVESKDWPIICTYDSFATMLERSLRFAQRNVFSSRSETSGVEISNKRVDFGKFKRVYWPSFSGPAKKGLSVDGVFSEIIGVIKANSSSSNYEPLSEDQYQKLSYRAAPNFHPGPEREAVYGLYKVYEKRKAAFSEWDDLDRTAKLQKLLAQDEKLSLQLRSKITEVFVDEIQDQRLPEIELLLDLVDNMKSFAFAGDTAQCISRDSCFRFQDLKAAFFRRYERFGILSGQEHLAKLSRFTLSKNYRTHNGILRLAAKVVDVLSTAFPYAIDKFEPELGEFDGPQPIIFCGFGSEIFVPRQGDESTTISEFGAEQVLIVRDDEAKDALLKTMGDKVLILTILESKGMEFQDVFLFDFFTGSHCHTALRALAYSQTTGGRFDDTKYPELCIELKNLYVAVTRSREMLYIIESKAEAVQPISDMWGPGSGDTIVDIVSQGDPTLRTRLDEIKQGQSDPGEWKQKGDEFFNQRMYEQALYCYRRAGKVLLVDMCQASIAERSGRDVISDLNCLTIAREHYLEAARLFYKCEKYEKALKCYESIGEYKSAGDLCENLSKKPGIAKSDYTLRAGDYFMRANDIEKALLFYRELKLHDRVIEGYRKLDDVKELINYLKEHRTEMDKTLYNRNARIIALTTFSSQNSNSSLRRPAISLLSEQEQEQLYRQFKFTEELKMLLISQNRLTEAMEISYSEGNWEDVGKLLAQMEMNGCADLQFISTRGEDFARRVLFYEFSRSVAASARRGNVESLKKGILVRNMTLFPQASRLFKKISEVLKASLVGKVDYWLVGTNDASADAQTLVDLMILQSFVSEKPKGLSRGLCNGALMGGIILRCSRKLLEIYRSRKLADSIIELFFGIIQTQNANGCNIIGSSPIYHGGSGRAQKITNEELMERLIRILQEWIVKGYAEYVGLQDAEYTGRSVCRHFVIRGNCDGRCHYSVHKTNIPEDEMISYLELAWSMAVLTSHCEYLHRNGVIYGNDLASLIKTQGHKWWERVFKSMIVVTDLIQSPSTRPFLIEKKSGALRARVSDHAGTRAEGQIILGCLDNFQWRLKRMVQNMGQPDRNKVAVRNNAEGKESKIDFWSLLDAWERMEVSKVRGGYEKHIWWTYLRDVEPYETMAMRQLHDVESCLWNKTKTAGAMRAFSQGFKSNLGCFGELKDIHLLLNRLDRAMAVVIYIASSNILVLKKSQLEYLQRYNLSNRNVRREYHADSAAAAENVLNETVGLYNWLHISTTRSQNPLWYREAMCRRIEGNAIISILNSKAPTDIPGGTEFMQEFLYQATKNNFWIARRGSVNPYAAWNVPNRCNKFVGWILENIDVVESRADPIIYSQLDEKWEKPKRFQLLPTVPFENPVSPVSALEAETTNADAVDDFENMGVDESLVNDRQLVIAKAAETIQRNWRICGAKLRNTRYLDQDPKHRRITEILKSQELLRQLDSEEQQKCFRMVVFVLLDFITEIHVELGSLSEKLTVISIKRTSMEEMEKILGGHDQVRDYVERVEAIEQSIAPSVLVTSISTGSITSRIFTLIREAKEVHSAVSSTKLELENWIQGRD